MMRNLIASLEPIRVEGAVDGRERVILRPSAAVQEQSQHRLDRIRDLVRQVDQSLDVSLTTESPEHQPTAPAAHAARPDLLKKVQADPLVQRAIELFDARIVNVQPRED